MAFWHRLLWLFYGKRKSLTNITRNTMGTKFNFNSAICTSRSQSERLLALGLKKETADMYWTKPFGDWIAIVGEGKLDEDNIPAWSLHRLIEMLALCPYEIYPKDNVFEEIIYDIEEAIKEGYFNKEYLEE